jgi:glycosyltransferase involved in cell wall biosynthesis
MKLLGEIIGHGIEGLLPLKIRLPIAKKIAGIQAQGLIPLPRVRTKVFCFSGESRKLFPDGEFIGGKSNSKKAEQEVEEKEDPILIPKYSLVSTCYNESTNIIEWLDSILRQEVLPDEIVVVDGGSRDNTIRLISRWADSNKIAMKEEDREKNEGVFFLNLVCVGEGQKLNISEGRNKAASLAKNSIILFSDAGTVLDRYWAKRLLLPFAKDSELEAVFGWYKPITKNIFSKAMSHYLLPRLEAIEPETFLPSGRSWAVKKKVFLRTPKYPEFLTRAGEDSLYGQYLKSFTFSCAFVPDAIAFWKFPEGVIKTVRTVFNYACGDAESGKLFSGYYISLVPKVLFGYFELFLFFLIGQLPKNSVTTSLQIVLFGSFLLRWVVIVCAYRPWRNSRTIDSLFRICALVCLTNSQVFGYLRGLKNRKTIEAKRISQFSSGHIVCLLPEVVDNIKFVGSIVARYLEKGYSLTAICDRVPLREDGYQHPVSHPGIDQYLLKSFDLESWWEKYRGFVENGLKIEVIDELQMPDSKLLAKKIAKLINPMEAP